jgi:hypothetical protein
LLEEKAATGFLKREEKPLEKVKAAKVSLPSNPADTTATCFKCGKADHLRKDCKDGKTTTPQSRGFCSGCSVKGYTKAKCWKLHPDLKPTGSKGAKTSRSEKDKETKATTGNKTSWKAKFVELEAKMAAINATTTSGGGKPVVTPNFHAGGGFVPDDDEFGDFMLRGMALTAVDMTLEAFANTRSQTTVPKDVPRGASSSLDPQRGEGSRQARLPESFTLDEWEPTSSMGPPSRVEALTAKTTCKGLPSEEASKVVREATTLVC